MIDKDLIVGMSMEQQFMYNAAIFKEREEIVERVEKVLQLVVVGIPEDPFLSGDIPDLEHDLCLAEMGDQEAKIRIFLLLKERTLAMAITVKGDYMSDEFKKEIIDSGEEIIEPGYDGERVELIMASYFEILDKLSQLDAIIPSVRATEFDYVSAMRELGANAGEEGIAQLAVIFAKERAEEENEKIRKARYENSKNAG